MLSAPAKKSSRLFAALCSAGAILLSASCQKSPPQRPTSSAAAAVVKVEPLPAIDPAESAIAHRNLQARLASFYSLPGYVCVSPRATPPRRGLVASPEITTTYVLRSSNGERLIRMENAVQRGGVLERQFVGLKLPTGQWVLVGDTAILDRSMAEVADDADHALSPGDLDAAAKRPSSEGALYHMRSDHLGQRECEVFTIVSPHSSPAPTRETPPRASSSPQSQRTEYWFAPDGFLMRTRLISSAGVVLSDRMVSEYRLEPPQDPALFTVPADSVLVVAGSRAEVRQQIILAMKKTNRAKNKPTS